MEYVDLLAQSTGALGSVWIMLPLAVPALLACLSMLTGTRDYAALECALRDSEIPDVSAFLVADDGRDDAPESELFRTVYIPSDAPAFWASLEPVEPVAIDLDIYFPPEATGLAA